MAHALGEAGARLVITARKEAELETGAAELRAAGIEVTPMVADLGDEDVVIDLAARAIAELGHIDILVNNAGVTREAPAST